MKQGYEHGGHGSMGRKHKKKSYGKKGYGEGSHNLPKKAVRHTKRGDKLRSATNSTKSDTNR